MMTQEGGTWKMELESPDVEKINDAHTKAWFVARVKTDLKNIQAQLQAYQTANGFLPSTEQGLKALVEKPTGDPQPQKWKQLLTKIPDDLFGMPYNYNLGSVHSTAPYDLYSGGPDRIPGDADDIGNW